MPTGDGTPRDVSAASDAAKKALQKSRNLQFVLREIINTESDYAQDLKLLINHLKKLKEDAKPVDFIRSIQEEMPFLKTVSDLLPDSAWTTFIKKADEEALPLLEKMLASSEAMIQELTPLISEDQGYIKIVRILNQKTNENEKLYADYLKVHSELLPQLENISDKEQKFLTIEEPKTPEGKPIRPGRDSRSVQAFLIMPVQRLPRYKLLLNEISKNVPQDETLFFGQKTRKLEATLENINKSLPKKEVEPSMIDRTISLFFSGPFVNPPVGGFNQENNRTYEEKKKGFNPKH